MAVTHVNIYTREGEPQKAKALLRLLIQEIRVNGRAQVQPTYRLLTPEVCATSEKWAHLDRTRDLSRVKRALSR